MQTPTACSGEKCPVSSAQFLTEEGPVLVEQWANNSVIVSESFDVATALKVRDAVRDGESSEHAEDFQQPEIGMRLYEFPAFREFAERIGAQIVRRLQAQ